MTNRLPTLPGATKTVFWTTAVAVASIVVLIVVLGGHQWSDAPNDDGGKSGEARDDETNEHEPKSSQTVDEDKRNGTNESREEKEPKKAAEARTKGTGESTLAEEVIADNTTKSPPSTPVKTTKGKKWRDRLSAKKQHKLKQHAPKLPHLS